MEKHEIYIPDVSMLSKNLLAAKVNWQFSAASPSCASTCPHAPIPRTCCCGWCAASSGWLLRPSAAPSSQPRIYEYLLQGLRHSYHLLAGREKLTGVLALSNQPHPHLHLMPFVPISFHTSSSGSAALSSSSMACIIDQHFQLRRLAACLLKQIHGWSQGQEPRIRPKPEGGGGATLGTFMRQCWIPVSK